MRTFTRNFRFFKQLAVFIFMVAAKSASAQQLYSDSAVAAKVHENLCMVLPDTTYTALQEDTSTLFAQLPSSNSMAYVVFTPGCGECMSYSYSNINWASFLISPISLYCVTPTSVCAEFIQSVPVSRESAVGCAASSPLNGVAFGPASSDVAQACHSANPCCS